MKRASLMLVVVALAMAGCGGGSRGSSSSASASDPASAPSSVPGIAPDIIQLDGGQPLPDGGTPTYGQDGGSSQNGQNCDEQVTLKMEGFDRGDFTYVPVCIKDVKVYADGDCLDVKLLQTEIDLAQCTLYPIARFDLPQQANKVRIKIELNPDCGQAQDTVVWTMDEKGLPIDFAWDADQLRQDQHLTVHVDLLKTMAPDTTSLLFLPNIIVRSGALHQPGGECSNVPWTPPPPPSQPQRQ